MNNTDNIKTAAREFFTAWSANLPHAEELAKLAEITGETAEAITFAASAEVNNHPEDIDDAEASFVEWCLI